MMFAAWCTLAAAIAYDLGWRVQFEDRSDLLRLPPTREARLADLAIYFASGRLLPEAPAMEEFMQRKIQEIDGIFRRFGWRMQKLSEKYSVK